MQYKAGDTAWYRGQFGHVEYEGLVREPADHQPDARAALFDFIEVFYNRQRRHSALGYLSPERFERSPLQTPVVA